jgi:hypothetical protein
MNPCEAASKTLQQTRCTPYPTQRSVNRQRIANFLNLGSISGLTYTYKQLWIAPRVRPLLTTDNPTSDRFLAWIGPCATSRVVAIQLGHGLTVFSHPGYPTLVHNAILWSAGRSRDSRQRGGSVFRATLLSPV